MLKKRLLRVLSLYIVFPVLFIIILPLLIFKGAITEIRNYVSMVIDTINNEYK